MLPTDGKWWIFMPCTPALQTWRLACWSSKQIQGASQDCINLGMLTHPLEGCGRVWQDVQHT